MKVGKWHQALGLRRERSCCPPDLPRDLQTGAQEQAVVNTPGSPLSLRVTLPHL